MNINTITDALLSEAPDMPDWAEDVLEAVTEAVAGIADMELSHTPGVGTVLEFPYNKAWGAAVSDMRYPRFVWSDTRGAYYIQHTTNQRVPLHDLDSLAAVIEKTIPGVRVSVEVRPGTVASVAEQEAARKARAEARQERYSGYAEGAAQKAEAADKRGRNISRRFEFGQPVLVGHHSERGARRDRERIDQLSEKSHVESKKSEHWTARAAGSEAHSERREAPDVVQRRIVEKERELREIRRSMVGSPGHNRTTGEPMIVKPSEAGLRRLQAEEERLVEEIAYWRSTLEDQGLRSRTADDFRVGSIIGGYAVLRVGDKGITLATLTEGGGGVQIPGTENIQYSDMKPTTDAPPDPAPEPEQKGKHPRAALIDSIYRKFEPNGWKIRIGWKHAIVEELESERANGKRYKGTMLTVLEDAPDAVLDRLAEQYKIPLTGEKTVKHPHAKLIKAIYSGARPEYRKRYGEKHSVTYGGEGHVLEDMPEDRLRYLALSMGGVDPDDYDLPFPSRDARIRAFLRSQRFQHPGKNNVRMLHGADAAEGNAYHWGEIYKLPPEQTMPLERLSDADLLRVVLAFRDANTATYRMTPADRLQEAIRLAGV